MGKNELLEKLSINNGSTIIIAFNTYFDTENAYNSAKELEKENKIEIKDIGKTGQQLFIKAKVK
ncbi:hypothetical protein ACFFIX_08300 [Metabacillus herbersteinensis]|uniref:Uncharacterized protein n=1 Tax=Metabacillus herbersteinensis TaxID=283816 RepID=A0ABV6GD14_9BACI